MGLMLINALVEQINGSLKIESKKGTRCVVKFPIDIDTST